MLDDGWWILDDGWWMLHARYWILDIGDSLRYDLPTNPTSSNVFRQPGT